MTQSRSLSLPGPLSRICKMSLSGDVKQNLRHTASPSQPSAACRRVPSPASPALPCLASLTVPLQGLPSGWPPLMLLRASSSFIRIISTFQGPAKIFSVELVLSDHCYKGLSSFSAQTLPASHILPFAALLTHIWGGASPLSPCVSPPARGASVQMPRK